MTTPEPDGKPPELPPAIPVPPPESPLFERPLAESLDTSTPEPPWLPPSGRDEAPRRPPLGLRVLVVVALLSLAVGCSFTGSTPVRLGLIGVAILLLRWVGSAFGGAQVSRLVLVAGLIFVLVPTAAVLFLLAVCVYGDAARGSP